MAAAISVALTIGAGPMQIRDDFGERRLVLLHGQITATLGATRGPVEGASIELERFNNAGPHATAAAVVTDSAGRYAITDLAQGPLDVPYGRYVLYVEYRTIRRSLGTVVLSRTTTVTKNAYIGKIVRLGGAAPPPPMISFYVTDRLANRTASVPASMFSNGRLIDPCAGGPDCMMSYGMVSPQGPFLSATKAGTVEQLISDIRSVPAFTHSSSFLVFIHGYNSDFFDPLEIGATWLTHFDPNEPVIVYSWPSNHVTAKYFDDETNNTWAQAHFRDFMLALMNAKDGPQTVNVLAHSMGNRLAVGFLDFLASSKISTNAKIGQAFFAAPDVDSATFFEAVPRMATVAQGLTMYGSDHDNALRLSRALHGHCRAGLVNCDYAVPNVPNFNAIDASMFHCDLLGHGYWLGSDTLRADIIDVLKNGVMRNGTVRAHLSAGSQAQSFVFTSAAPSDAACEAQAKP